VYYGSIYQKKPSAAEKSTGRDSKLARINQMRKIYLPKKRKAMFKLCYHMLIEFQTSFVIMMKN